MSFFDNFYITKRLKLHKLQNVKKSRKVISHKLLTFFNDVLLSIIEIFTLLKKYLYQVHMLETCQFYKQCALLNANENEHFLQVIILKHLSTLRITLLLKFQTPASVPSITM